MGKGVLKGVGEFYGCLFWLRWGL